MLNVPPILYNFHCAPMYLFFFFFNFFWIEARRTSILVHIRLENIRPSRLTSTFRLGCSGRKVVKARRFEAGKRCPSYVHSDT